MKSHPIGIIDSGIGGISIASSIIKELPRESIIYVADSKNCPYGQRSREEIYQLSKKMVEFLLKRNIKLLIVACNTITVICIDLLRYDYPQIPIVGIAPVLKTASERTKNKKIGIFSTQNTAKSKYLKNLIDKFAKDCDVISLGSVNLVPKIEKLDFKATDRILKGELRPFKEAGIDTLALGCSHFSLIRDQIQKFLPEVLILDSAGAVARQVRRVLEKNSLLSSSSTPSYNFYTTSDIKGLNYFVGKLTKKSKIERISLQ